jgi:hypothetical protein
MIGVEAEDIGHAKRSGIAKSYAYVVGIDQFSGGTIFFTGPGDSVTPLYRKIMHKACGTAAA